MMTVSESARLQEEKKFRRKIISKVTIMIEELKGHIDLRKRSLTEEARTPDFCDQAVCTESKSEDQAAIFSYEEKRSRLEKWLLELKDRSKPLACPCCGRAIFSPEDSDEDRQDKIERIESMLSFECAMCAKKKQPRAMVRH